MKTVSAALLLMASMAFVLTGCSDNPGPGVTPASTNQSHAPSLGKIDGPGAWIVRGQFNNWWFFIDEKYVVVIGVNDFASACAGDGIWPQSSGTVVPFKDVMLPNADPNLRRIVEQFKGSDLAVTVWDASLFTWPYLCDLYRNYQPLAVGTAHLIYTDSDLLAWAQDNPNVNTFRYKVNGKLTAPNGQVYTLNLVYHVVWDPDGTNYQETFKTNLTPTGGK